MSVCVCVCVYGLGDTATGVCLLVGVVNPVCVCACGVCGNVCVVGGGGWNPGGGTRRAAQLGGDPPPPVWVGVEGGERRIRGVER